MQSNTDAPLPVELVKRYALSTVFNGDNLTGLVFRCSFFHLHTLFHFTNVCTALPLSASVNDNLKVLFSAVVSETTSSVVSQCLEAERVVGVISRACFHL